MQVKDLKFDKRNYRKHNKENLDLISKSIKEVGFGRSIVINSDNEIICGNGVTSTLQEDVKLKVVETDGTELIVVKRNDLKTGDIKQTKLGILDNSASDSSEFDLELLSEDFNASELLEMGINSEDLEGIANNENEEIQEDEVPEIQEKEISKLGDLWILGNHRLLCGDATKIEDIEKLMNGEKADMVFTDPPYGMKKEKDGILNDNLNSDDLLEFNKQWIPLTFANTKGNGSWYCWGIDEPLMDIYSNILKPMIKENEITFRNLITWDKGTGQGQKSKEFLCYVPADEKCLFVMCGVQGFHTNADNYPEQFEKIRAYFESEIKTLNLSDQKIAEGLGFKSSRAVNHWYSKSQFEFINEANFDKLKAFGRKLKADFLKREYDELKREYYKTRAYFDNVHDNMNSVWHFSKTSPSERKQTGGHATPKPIALCSRAIKTSSRKNETILDVFGGSGSTLIACEQLNRRCFMMEIAPKYCDVIIRRWQNLTQQKAILAARGQTFEELEHL